MPIYSHSQLSVYEQCPLKYKLRYRDKIKRVIESIESFLGSRVHETLQKCYDDLRFNKVNSLANLLAYYNNIWRKNWNASIIITKEELTQEHYRILGEKLIGTYYARYAPFNSDITIGVEMNIRFSLDEENKYRLTGYIDRLSRTQDDLYEIHDYKTSSYLPPQEEIDKDKQLALYHVGIQKKWPDIRNINLVWHYMAFDRELVSHRSPEAITSLVEDTKKLIDEIESARDFPPHESSLCNWCEYPDLCPLRKHIFKVEALPSNEYLSEPGVVLVNKYAVLKSEKEEIENEMNKVKEAIFDYAIKEELDVIKGSGHKIRVKFDEKLKFPGKQDAERQKLDAIIKEAGKWNEVSDLNTTALTDVVENKLWDKDLIDKVLKYGRIEGSSSIHLLKLPDV